VTSALFGVRYHLTGRWAVGLDWGLMTAGQTAHQLDSQWRFGAGNPTVKLTRTLLEAGPHLLAVYAAIAHPLAWLPDSPAERGLVRAGYAYSAATRGLWDAWLWAPEQVTAVVGANWSLALTDHTALRLELSVAAALSLSGSGRRATEYAQLAPELEVHFARVHAGLRLQSVVMSGWSDPLQLSVSPFVRADLQQWQLELRAVLNIDEPLGFMDAGLGIWGWLLAVRGTL
jgi:hypothetical protein